MSLCIICHFETERDDVVVATLAGGCICLGCFARETDTARAMPKALRRELRAALAAIGAA